MKGLTVMTNDAELLERWSTRGDAQAFDSLVTGYSGLVYSACKRILRNDADAQDATQECFLQLAQKKPDIRTSLAAWLHTVATRKAISRIREETRRARREQTYAKDADTAVEADWDDVQEFIDEAIRSLPTDIRLPVVANFLERKSHADIAKELGVDRSTVRRRIDRGVEGIRDFLKEKGVIATSASLLTMLTTKMTEAMPVGLTGSLAKIALTGGRLQAAGGVTGGGFLGGRLTAGKMAAGVFALSVLIGGVWWWSSQRSPSEPVVAPVVDAPRVAEAEREVAEVSIPRRGSDPELMQNAVSSENAESVDSVVEPQTIAGIEGRVFDSITNRGLDGVIVSAYPRGGTRENQVRLLASVETEQDGHFSVPDLGVGAYRLSTDKVEGYPETTFAYVEVQSPSERVENVEIALDPGGVLAGVAILGKDPLPDADLTIDSFSGGTRDLGQLRTRTDSRGRYRIEDLPKFEGTLIASRIQLNGSTQDALVVPATIRPGEVTEINFDFIWGTASIEGGVFFQNEQTPIQANIQVFFGWEDDGTYREEIIRARTDETGYYIVEGLPAGNAEIHVDPVNSDGNLRRTETLVLAEGQQAVKDIVLSAMTLRCQIANVPERTVLVFLLAHPGEVKVEMTDVASFMAMRNSMVSYDQLSAVNKIELSGELSGLKPGRYTISASAWPTGYSLAAIQAYGQEKFFEDLRIVSTVVDITETDQTLDLHFDFASP